MTADAFIAAVEKHMRKQGHPSLYLVGANSRAIRAAWAELPTPTRVEVTPYDVEVATEEKSGDYTIVESFLRCSEIAEAINARLRARAGDATPRIVRRPSRPGVSQLVVSKDGSYAPKYSGGWALPRFMAENERVHPEVTAIRAWDFRTGDVGPVIERVEAPVVSEWTADDIPAMGKPFWYWRRGSPEGRGLVRTPHDDYDAMWFNADLGVTAWCYVLVPSEVPNV